MLFVSHTTRKRGEGNPVFYILRRQPRQIGMPGEISAISIEKAEEILYGSPGQTLFLWPRRVHYSLSVYHKKDIDSSIEEWGAGESYYRRPLCEVLSLWSQVKASYKYYKEAFFDILRRIFNHYWYMMIKKEIDIPRWFRRSWWKKFGLSPEAMTELIGSHFLDNSQSLVPYKTKKQSQNYFTIGPLVCLPLFISLSLAYCITVEGSFLLSLRVKDGEWLFRTDSSCSSGSLAGSSA